jgi:hypothetical protein
MPRARALPALVLAAAALAPACQDGDALGTVDGGLPPADAGSALDAGAGDAAGGGDAGGAPDAGASDVGPDDAGPFECDPFAVPADPTQPAALTGRIEIFDFYIWESDDQAARRWRNFGLIFLTGTLPTSGVRDAILFRGVPEDDCITVDLPAPRGDRGPARNIGTELVVETESGVRLRLDRRNEVDGVNYPFPSGPELARFGDPAITSLDQRWTWSTPGDRGARVRPASATLAPVEDFQVTPAFTSTPTPTVLDPAGTHFQWTPPVRTPGELRIVLGRALSPEGDGRFLICHPRDDGDFTLTSTAIAAFGAVPGLPFDLDVSRGQVAAFCNEGVRVGAVTHTLVHSGLGVIR